jgi:hypothetical protein
MKITKKQLQELIRELLKELQSDELEEISTTGGVAGYNTPNAFKKTNGTDEESKPDNAYVDKLNKGTGYTRVYENRWVDLKKSEGSPNKKIGEGIRNIRKQIQEIEKFVEWYSKIKSESGLDSGSYWKRTQRHLSVIRERMDKLSHKIRELSV